MKKQEPASQSEPIKHQKKPDDNQPQPSSSRDPQSSLSATSVSSSSSSSASAAPIDFGDASQYVEVSPIGTGNT